MESKGGQTQPRRMSGEREEDETAAEAAESQAFGVALDKLMAAEAEAAAEAETQGARAGGTLLPRVLHECIAYLWRNGLDTEGLFRRSPPSTALRAAKLRYSRGQAVDLEAAGVHVAAVLLKVFFRELPDAVFGGGYAAVRALPAARVGKDADADADTEADADAEELRARMEEMRTRYVREEIVAPLSKATRHALCGTFALLHAVARNETRNRMTAYSLAVVWAPNLARSADPAEDVAMCAAGPAAATVGGVVQIMVQAFGAVFGAEISDLCAGADGGAEDESEAVGGEDAASRVLAAIARSGTLS
ncbi:hypothetical protein GGI11_006262 [Coemansia sp. RSA 2049]|nr:hypothetical protein GGI11_006262 [Coemansia sp. RSA 2049]